MFPATCSKCGRSTEVPFQPTNGKPVYCSDCFRSVRGNYPHSPPNATTRAACPGRSFRVASPGVPRRPPRPAPARAARLPVPGSPGTLRTSTRSAARGRPNHGRRLQQRLRPDRPRRRHRRLHRRFSGRSAGHERRARGPGQDRWDLPARRLHPDQGAPRIGRAVRAPQEGQGVRDPAGRPARLRLRGDRPAARPGREADVDRPAGPRRQEQGDVGRGARSPRGRRRDPRRAQRRGRHARRRRRARPPRPQRDPGHRQPRQEPARPRPRRPPDHHLGRRHDQGGPAEEHRHRRRGRRRLRVRLAVSRPGRRGHAARIPAGGRPARRPRRQRGPGAQLHPARHQGRHQGPLRHRVRQGDRRRRLDAGRPRRRRRRGAARRAAAGRDRSGAQHRGRSASRRRRSSSSAGSSRSTAGCGPPSRTSTPSAT